MTANQRAMEQRITAFLDGPDDRNIPNAIHSTRMHRGSGSVEPSEPGG